MSERIVTIRMPDEVLLKAFQNQMVMHMFRGQPEWRGPLGLIQRVSLVGHRFASETPLEKFTGQVSIAKDNLNQHDPNAIAVYHNGLRVAYVRRYDTHILHRLWEQFDQTGKSKDKPKLLSHTTVGELYICDSPE